MTWTSSTKYEKHNQVKAMSNEHANEPGHGGDGGGDDRFGREEPTVVVVPRSFLIGSLGRAASALHGAGDVCLDARALVTQGAGASAIGDLIEELTDLASVIAGMARALQRIEFEDNEGKDDDHG